MAVRHGKTKHEGLFIQRARINGPEPRCDFIIIIIIIIIIVVVIIIIIIIIISQSLGAKTKQKLKCNEPSIYFSVILKHRTSAFI